MERPTANENTPTVEPTAKTLATLLSAIEGIGRGRAAAEVALSAMIDADPQARVAMRVLVRMADDAGLDTGARLYQWPSAAHAAHVEFDQLLALGAASSWADPGFLVDPDGSQGAGLATFVYIARARRSRQEEGVTAESVVWLEEAMKRESRPLGRAARRAATLSSWPLNARGEMDGAYGEAYLLILGSLAPVEVRFRGGMAAIAAGIETTPDDLRRARALALRLLETVHSVSLRMSGLAQAALARVYLTQAQIAGKRIPGLEGRPAVDTASVFLSRAERLLSGSGKATLDDDRGCRALRGAIEARQAMAGPGHGQGSGEASSVGE